MANYIKKASYSILSCFIISLPPIYNFVLLRFLQGIVSRDEYFISGLKNEISMFGINEADLFILVVVKNKLKVFACFHEK